MAKIDPNRFVIDDVFDIMNNYESKIESKKKKNKKDKRKDDKIRDACDTKATDAIVDNDDCLNKLQLGGFKVQINI